MLSGAVAIVVNDSSVFANIEVIDKVVVTKGVEEFPTYQWIVGGVLGHHRREVHLGLSRK